MRVLHVPVASPVYDSEQIGRLISQALTNYPSLNQIVLHFQGAVPEDRTEPAQRFTSPYLRLEITDSDSW